MSFCTLGSDYIKDGYTQIDNVFLGKFLPNASGDDIKVYLYGLMLALNSAEDNSLEKLSLALRMPEERVIASFKYWENQGLVSIAKAHPLRVSYLSVKSPLRPVIKYNAGDYSIFVEEMARIFPNKVLDENEIMSYIDFMHDYKVETNAMLMIAKYCQDVRGTVSTSGILSVATEWAKQGVTSEVGVNAHIEEVESATEDMRSIYATLGLKSTPDIDAKNLYVRWTKEYGYKMDAILVAARACKKKGGYSRLEKLMEELHLANTTSAIEVSAYLKKKDAVHDLALAVVKNLGTYYASLDIVIETYIIPWQNRGFDDNALLEIAKFCFLRSIKSLEGMADAVDKFHKLGILSANGVVQYIAKQVALDNSVKEVLHAAESESFVSNTDRELYRTFIEIWGFEHEVVTYVASTMKGKPYPMSATSKVLGVLKSNNIYGLDAVKSFLQKSPSQKAQASDATLSQNYTAEQLSSVFVDSTDVDWSKLKV